MDNLERKETSRERYDKKNCYHMTLKFNIKTDADIVEKLTSVPNKQGYIKQLIRADLAEK